MLGTIINILGSAYFCATQDIKTTDKTTDKDADFEKEALITQLADLNSSLTTRFFRRIFGKNGVKTFELKTIKDKTDIKKILDGVTYGIEESKNFFSSLFKQNSITNFQQEVLRTFRERYYENYGILRQTVVSSCGVTDAMNKVMIDLILDEKKPEGFDSVFSDLLKKYYNSNKNSTKETFASMILGTSKVFSDSVEKNVQKNKFTDHGLLFILPVLKKLIKEVDSTAKIESVDDLVNNFENLLKIVSNTLIASSFMKYTESITFKDQVFYKGYVAMFVVKALLEKVNLDKNNIKDSDWKGIKQQIKAAFDALKKDNKLEKDIYKFLTMSTTLKNNNGKLATVFLLLSQPKYNKEHATTPQVIQTEFPYNTQDVLMLSLLGNYTNQQLEKATQTFSYKGQVTLCTSWIYYVSNFFGKNIADSDLAPERLENVAEAILGTFKLLSQEKSDAFLHIVDKTQFDQNDVLLLSYYMKETSKDYYEKIFEAIKEYFKESNSGSEALLHLSRLFKNLFIMYENKLNSLLASNVRDTNVTAEIQEVRKFLLFLSAVSFEQNSLIDFLKENQKNPSINELRTWINKIEKKQLSFSAKTSKDKKREKTFNCFRYYDGVKLSENGRISLSNEKSVVSNQLANSLFEIKQKRNTVLEVVSVAKMEEIIKDIDKKQLRYVMFVYDQNDQNSLLSVLNPTVEEMSKIISEASESKKFILSTLDAKVEKNSAFKVYFTDKPKTNEQFCYLNSLFNLSFSALEANKTNKGKEELVLSSDKNKKTEKEAITLNCVTNKDFLSALEGKNDILSKIGQVFKTSNENVAPSFYKDKNIIIKGGNLIHFDIDPLSDSFNFVLLCLYGEANFQKQKALIKEVMSRGQVKEYNFVIPIKTLELLLGLKEEIGSNYHIFFNNKEKNIVMASAMKKVNQFDNSETEPQQSMAAKLDFFKDFFSMQMKEVMLIPETEVFKLELIKFIRFAESLAEKSLVLLGAYSNSKFNGIIAAILKVFAVAFENTLLIPKINNKISECYKMFVSERKSLKNNEGELEMIDLFISAVYYLLLKEENQNKILTGNELNKTLGLNKNTKRTTLLDVVNNEKFKQLDALQESLTEKEQQKLYEEFILQFFDVILDKQNFTAEELGGSFVDQTKVKINETHDSIKLALEKFNKAKRKEIEKIEAEIEKFKKDEEKQKRQEEKNKAKFEKDLKKKEMKGAEVEQALKDAAEGKPSFGQRVCNFLSCGGCGKKKPEKSNKKEAELSTQKTTTNKA